MFNKPLTEYEEKDISSEYQTMHFFFSVYLKFLAQNSLSIVTTETVTLKCEH